MSQLLSQLLPGGGPIVADAVAKLNNMAFKVYLILLEPGDIQFLARGATLELARDILLVVFDNSTDEALKVVASMVIRTAYLVMMPVVLTPSVLCVTRNLPSRLMGV